MEFYLLTFLFLLGDGMELSSKVPYETVISLTYILPSYPSLCELQVSHHNISPP